MNWPEIIAELIPALRDEFDAKRANGQVLIVWDGEAVREWAPWEPMQ